MINHDVYSTQVEKLEAELTQLRAERQETTLQDKGLYLCWFHRICSRER